jgi:hypothetical protein
VTTAPSKARKIRQKVGAHRARLRACGLRPVQIWVPDLASARLAAEAHRQSLNLAMARGAEADHEFIDAISDGA